MKRLKKMVEQVVCLWDDKLTQILLMLINFLAVKHDYWLEMGGKEDCKKAQDIMLLIRYLDILNQYSRVFVEMFVSMIGGCLMCLIIVIVIAFPDLGKNVLKLFVDVLQNGVLSSLS